MSHNQYQLEVLQELGLGPLWVRKTTLAIGCPGDLPSDVAPAAVAGTASSESGVSWENLQTMVQVCQDCPLSQSRTQSVFGAGAKQGDVLVIGEAPGAEEDRVGEPFVGQAGKLLDNMLKSIGESRDKSVYIANVLKCRPPGNRDPHALEVAACEGHLKQQIRLLKPKLIVVVGRIAAQTLLNTDNSIGQLRGKQFEYDGIPVLVTYHPAYLLRSPQEKAKAWADLLKIHQTIQSLRQPQ